jgi:hypothetical protein
MCPPHSFTFIDAEDYAASYTVAIAIIYLGYDRFLQHKKYLKTIFISNLTNLRKYLFLFFIPPFQG